MEKHKCEHEGKIATILEKTSNMETTLSGLVGGIDGIYNILNGPEGVVTQTALGKQNSKDNKASINKLWTTVRIFIFSLLFLVLGVVIKVAMP